MHECNKRNNTLETMAFLWRESKKVSIWTACSKCDYTQYGPKLYRGKWTKKRRIFILRLWLYNRFIASESMQTTFKRKRETPRHSDINLASCLFSFCRAMVWRYQCRCECNSKCNSEFFCSVELFVPKVDNPNIYLNLQIIHRKRCS